MDQSFGKSYKLCSKKVIESLFKEGKTIRSFPYKLVYKTCDLPTETSFQLAIAVPKRQFKRAPDRNRIKRLIREAVRKNKGLIEKNSTENKQLALFLIFIGKEINTYQDTESKIVSLFRRLRKELDGEKHKKQNA